jgi:hypothetical protein
MAWPEYGVVKVEGRLAAAIDGTSTSHRLATRDELRAAPAAMGREVAGLLGAMPEGRAAGVGRFDLATERDFEDRVEGLDLLRAMRALRPPGCKVDVITAPDGRVETVAVVTARRARRLFRAYDKSVESGEGLPGSRVRFEAQVRRNASQRQGPNVVADSDLRAAFGRTIEPFMRGESVTVTSPAGVIDELASQVAGGSLTIAGAKRLAGASEFLRRYGRALYDSNDQSSRRLRALREAGIAVDDELEPGSRIAVSELLESALQEWSLGA